eukprot:360465-Chlamydomonas_euryale.AAC.11
MDIIENMPKKEREHMKQIFQSMVEARQNCEAIAFRGHRLLDQVCSACMLVTPQLVGGCAGQEQLCQGH